MRAGHVPGVAFAVVRNGKVERLSTYGEANLEWPSAVTPDTRFQLASATKLFTAVALMRLVEAQKLKLDDTLDRFFPESPPAWRGITVAQLANHTSGLAENLPDHEDNVAATVAAAMKTPLAYTSGSQSRYGFTDFIVLRAVMEKAAGKPLPDIFRDEIYLPAGLRDTGFSNEANWGPMRVWNPMQRRASVYLWKDGQQRASAFLFGETGYAAGGLFSSARDLAAFFAALDRGELLRPESIQALETPPVLANGKVGEFGVGWVAKRYNGTEVVGHSGGPALADVLRVEDRKLTIIALSNQQRFFPLFAESIADFYLPVPAAPRAIRDRQPQLTKLFSETLQAAAAGKLDKQKFGPEGQRDPYGFMSDFGQAMLVAVGTAQNVSLIREERNRGLLTRRYAVEFQRKRTYWQFAVDAQGKIEDLHPVGEQ